MAHTYPLLVFPSFLPRILRVVVSLADPPLASGVLLSTVTAVAFPIEMLRPTSGCLAVRQPNPPPPSFIRVMFPCLFILLLFYSFLLLLFSHSFLPRCCNFSFIEYLRRYHDLP
ncbi:hypothetical protein F5Y09DRAFT_106030 [Xylaria sp. FL1042]|nr:hypothetical protein F5Y09DRAFT_106030 [Xylaria sp. FL1042]